MDKEKEEKEVSEIGTPNTEQEPITAPESETKREGEGAEEPATKTEPEVKEKSRWQELAKRFTDEEADSEDEAFELIEAELTDLKEWKDTEKRINQDLIDALNAEPDFRQLIGFVLQGASFKEALVRAIDVESLTPAEGEPDRAGWEKAKGDRIERLKKMEEEDRAEVESLNRRQTNLGNTKALIQSFSEKHKLTPEEINTLKTKLADFTRDVLDMKVGEDTLDMILKSMRMDKIIDEAKEEAATEERNHKIEVMRQNREDETDGLPKLDAGAPVEKEDKPEGLSDFFGDVFKKHGL